MLEPIIAERYAKALYELSVEMDRLTEVKGDMDLLLETLKASRELKHLMVTPVVKPEKKYAVLHEIFKGRIEEITMRFFKLIVGKRRERNLEGIAREFIEKFKVHHNIVTIEIRTVTPLSDAMREKIIALIEQRRGYTVDLVEVTDEKLIGGFIVSTVNTRYDASLATSIKKLKKEFEVNLYIREI